MTPRIRTTHVGSLPRTQALLSANAAHEAGELDDADLAATLQREVDDVVARQIENGLSAVNDGEYGHLSTDAVDYGAWWTYALGRVGGIELTGPTTPGIRPPRSRHGLVHLSDFSMRRDWRRFAQAYADPDSGVDFPAETKALPVITGPLTYIGDAQVARDVDALTAALAATGRDTSAGFLAAVSPGSLARLADAHYADDEEVLATAVDVVAQEYRAITAAGLTVQIDAPDLAECWDQINPEPTLERYRAYLALRVEAINAALEGIDPALVRLHVCWGSWHGPHTTDVPLADILDLVLGVRATGLSFEAANVRHEHEWRVWQDVDLPEGAYLIPGVVSHATNVVEHPELVAERIARFAGIVGPERVMASTDCGLGGRIHPQIAWAKIAALAEGTRIAASRL